MSNNTAQLSDAVTLPKQEYLRLKQQAQAYRIMAVRMFELLLINPID